MQRAMLRANKLALRGLGRTSPNPIVGAVIVDNEGKEIASGFHVGGDHAEIVALKNAESFGISDFTKLSMVVTLEPCNHHGKTPPCSDAIIKAGFARVIYAVADPNPIARGGAEKIRKAGIEVIDGIEKEYVAYSNRAWLKKATTGSPWIITKIAASLDGKIAAADGSSKWITSDDARADVAILRNQSDAIVTTTETVMQDNPDLTPRFQSENPTSRSVNPVRIVMGNSEIPANAIIKNDRAETRYIKSRSLNELLDMAKAEGWNQVMVESGARFNSALFEADFVDEVVLYQAPTLLGRGKDFAGDLSISTLMDRKDLSFGEIGRVGRDLRIQLLRNNSALAEIFDSKFSVVGER
jgi:diaminohydroxyphosphoribosylaminopyrimidine deaminase/5-amino-6-(5-phosphoribosylamino)uracil reductase